MSKAQRTVPSGPTYAALARRKPHMLSVRANGKKSKVSLTECTFLFSLKNIVGRRGLVSSFRVRIWDIWDVLIFRESH